MSNKRLTLPDVRWFADYRPVCVIENEMKTSLKATNIFEYKEKLQQNAESIISTSRKVPNVVDQRRQKVSG